MKRALQWTGVVLILLWLCFCCLLVSSVPLHGQTISGLSYTTTESTIAATWTTDISSNSNITCGGIPGVDNGVAANSTSHQAIVKGLTVSTAYSCTVTSGSTTSSPSTQTTTAAPTRTPLTSGWINNPTKKTVNGDTLYNFLSNDNKTYITQDDGHGFTGSANAGANTQVGVLTTESTLTGTLVNLLTNYGAFNTFDGTDGPAGGTLSNKNSGLFGMNGSLYIFQRRQGHHPPDPIPSYYAYFNRSDDKGVTWNSWQAPAVFNANGVLPSPYGSSMFADTSISALTPIRYAGDDGTLGYNTAGNQIDGANAFVYMIFNDGWWDNGNALYLCRIPRIYFNVQDTAHFQFWNGPSNPIPADFVNDSNWSNSSTTKKAIFSSALHIGVSDAIFVPTMNYYLMLTWFQPTAGTTSVTKWNLLAGPTPAGPWTTIATPNPSSLANLYQFNPQGYYNPVVQHRTAAANVASSNIQLQILFTGDYGGGSSTYYFPTYSTLFLNPPGGGMQQYVSYGFTTVENPLSNGGTFSGTTGTSAIQVISSGVAEATAANTNCQMFYNALTFPNDQYSEITIQSVVAGGFPWPGVRMTATTGYIVVASGSGSQFKKYSSGTFTQVGSNFTMPTLNVGDVFRLQVVGTTLQAFLNGILMGTATDATIASGNAGLGAFSTTGLTQAQISFWASGAASFTISGSAGVGGATVSYTGTASGSVVADTAGNYTIANLVPGSYTLTPSKAGYIFTPASSNQTVTTSNITGVNFTATLSGFVACSNPNPNGSYTSCPCGTEGVPNGAYTACPLAQ